MASNSENSGSIREITNELIQAIFGANRVETQIRTDGESLTITDTKPYRVRWVYYGKVLVINEEETAMDPSLTEGSHANPEEEEFKKGGFLTRLTTKWFRVLDNVWFPSSKDPKKENMKVSIRSETSEPVILRSTPSTYHLLIAQNSNTDEMEFVINNLPPMDQQQNDLIQNKTSEFREQAMSRINNHKENADNKAIISPPPPAISSNQDVIQAESTPVKIVSPDTVVHDETGKPIPKN